MMCSMLKASGQKKSLVVVAVSSPYDFAMDKTIGTYICTFDFTEMAMQSLVRALFGEFTPRGTLPGTLRKSRKVLKSRQHWLVEPYDRARDSKGMHDLLQSLARASAPNHSYLQTTNPEAFELFTPNIEEAHFVVRNSSTHALYGFCATYYTKHTGIIGALFVDPAKRNLSIGRSLHRRAMRNLLQRRGIKKVQLGMCLPGVFLGIPVDNNHDGGNSNLRSWFSSSGWDLQPVYTKRLVNMHIPDLNIWSAPEGLLQNIQRASISFDLIHGLDNSESVLNHVATYASPEVYELYRLALQETKTCGVVRAKSPVDSLLGTVIIASPGSILSTLNPALSSSPSPSQEGNLLVGGGRGTQTGGILAPIVPSTAQASLVLQGLVLMGVRQNKAHKAGRSVVSWAQDEQEGGGNSNGGGAGGAGGVEALAAMGFRALQAFDEVTNAAEGFLGAD